MAKTNYQVTFNGKVVGIRKSDRIYTHAVVVDLPQKSGQG